MEPLGVCQPPADEVDLARRDCRRQNQFRNFYYTQKELFAGRHIATAWKPIDFARIAEGIGTKGYTIASPDEVEPTIKRVLSEPGPAIVSVITESVPTPEEEMFVQKIKNTGAIIGE